MGPVDDGWRFVSIGPESHSTDIGGGVNPWDVKWTPTNGRVIVPHPEYPSQRHTFDTYEVSDARPRIVFAAGEFSAGIWGFFVPR